MNKIKFITSINCINPTWEDTTGTFKSLIRLLNFFIELLYLTPPPVKITGLFEFLISLKIFLQADYFTFLGLYLFFALFSKITPFLQTHR